MSRGHTVCCRAGDETGGFGMGQRRKSEDLKRSCLLCWPTCFSGRFSRDACWSGGGATGRACQIMCLGGLSESVMIPTSYWEYHLFVEEIG